MKPTFDQLDDNPDFEQYFVSRDQIFDCDLDSKYVHVFIHTLVFEQPKLIEQSEEHSA